MKILFIGDIVGKPGRRAVRELLPEVVKDHDVDFIIANCENAAAGFGVTKDIVEELFRYNIDVLTSGNHIWDKKEVVDFLGGLPPVKMHCSLLAEDGLRAAIADYRSKKDAGGKREGSGT